MSIPADAPSSSFSPPKSTHSTLLRSSVSMSLHHKSTSAASPSRRPAPLPVVSVSKSDSSPPPAYQSTLESAPAAASSSSNSTSAGFCTTKTWRFEFAVEGVTNDDGRPIGLVGCIKVMLSIVVGTIMGIGGLIVSVTVVLVSTVFPSMQAKLPESVPIERVASRRPSPVSRRASSTPSSIKSNPSSGHAEARSPSTSPSLSARVDSINASERRVTFKIEDKPAVETASAGSAMGDISINTPTVPSFAPERPCLGRKDSLASSTSSRSLMSKLIRRRATSTQTEAVVESENEGSVAACTAGGSVPSTPAKSEIDLPTDSETPKRQRKMSLKIQLRGAFKRRSVGQTPVSTPGPTVSTPDSLSTTGSISLFSDAGSGEVQIKTPSSVASPLPSPSASKATKRTKGFPFQHSAPSSFPANRTDPYGYPHYAAPPSSFRSRRMSEDGTPTPKVTSKEDRRKTMDGVSTLGLTTAVEAPLAVNELGVLVSTPTRSGKRVVSDSSPIADKKKNRTTPLRSMSKPLTTAPPAPLDRHQRSAMAMASYSDTEASISPKRTRF